MDNKKETNLIVPTSVIPFQNGERYGEYNPNAELEVKTSLDKLRVFQFKNCTVLASIEQGIARTIFRDNTHLDALQLAPHTARFIGYDSSKSPILDAKRASAEHDIMHTIIAEIMGYGFSPNHFSIVHEGEPEAIPMNARDNEEIIIIGIQAYCNGCPSKQTGFERIIMKSFVKEAASRLSHFGISIDDIVNEILRILRP